MKQIFKRTLLLCLSCIMVMSVMLTSVSAEEGQVISINGTDTKFIELFSVEDGVIYLPLRLAFNDFEDQGYSVQIVPSIEKKNIAISVVKIDPVTGEIDEDRRGVFINWSDEILADAEFSNGRLELYQYAKDANGNNYLPTENYRRPTALSSALLFKDVDSHGGQRTFMSVDDLNNMVQFLIDDSNYAVKLK